jgi:heme-degrading monooxygenase HmoA
MLDGLAHTPEPPYYAVVFTSRFDSDDPAGYEAMAVRMSDLAARQPGYLGIESVRQGDGLGITVSYWEDLDAVHAWSRHADHLVAQEQGRSRWYAGYEVRVCRVERAYSYRRKPGPPAST